MRDHSSHVEIDRYEASRVMLEAASFHPRTELVPLELAIGRVLAADTLCQMEVPSVLTCGMDSIAVRWEDFQNGMPDVQGWQRGVQWQFANTGIAMPQGFDTAIVIEHVRLSEDGETLLGIGAAPSRKGAGTRAPGSKMHRGDVTASAGTLITPLVAAGIAAGNVSTVPVIAKPKVLFMATGNELVPPGSPFRKDGAFAAAGKTVETNSLLVRGKVEAWGGEFMSFDITPDDPELIAQRVREACSLADIVAINAGSSKGSDDWSIEELEETGRVLFHETNHGPGHHSSFAMVDGTPVVGVSGPPAGVVFTLDFYLRPLIMSYLGQDAAPRFSHAVLSAPFASHAHAGTNTNPDGSPISGEQRPTVTREGVTFYGVKPVRVDPDEQGRLIATPLKGRFGGGAASSANALYLLSSNEDEHPAAGDVIRVELL